MGSWLFPNVHRGCYAHHIAMRHLLIALVAVLATADYFALIAETDAIGRHLQNLSDPNVNVRINACHALGQVKEEDREVAVDALLVSLGKEASGSVRNVAIMALGEIGPIADKAIPSLIQLYRDGSGSKAELIKALGRIGPDSPIVIEFLIEVVRGGRAGAVRPMGDSKCPTSLRHEAIHAIRKIGPKASKSIPVLLDLLAVSATDIDHQSQTFEFTAETLSVVGVADKRVLLVLKRFQQGKGLPAKKKNCQAFENAILAADSAVKRLQQAEEVTGGE